VERLILQDGPYELLDASNGEEAVSTRSYTEKPDLILMDER
jgi:CheY-like chemotaxis protein